MESYNETRRAWGLGNKPGRSGRVAFLSSLGERGEKRKTKQIWLVFLFMHILSQAYIVGKTNKINIVLRFLPFVLKGITTQNDTNYNKTPSTSTSLLKDRQTG